MRNIRLRIMYDGGGYGGWQRLGSQVTTPSIQGVIEETLGEILEEEVKIIGSGRTDAGVHAYGQVANFHTNSSILLDKLKEELNASLGETIGIIKIEEVPDEFHSRFDAKSKTYEYCIDVREKACVFKRKYTTSMPGQLDCKKMKQAADYLVGKHDFAGFSTERKNNKDTIREIYWIEIYYTDNILHILLNGNGFLYNMVRIIVGTLVEVGTGKMLPKDMAFILEKRDRQLAGPTMSSQGLFLKDVGYDREGA